MHVADRVIHDAEQRGTENYRSRRSSRTRPTSERSRSLRCSAARGCRHWISKFGFGRTTGVDFPGESPGIVLPPDKWSGSTIGNVPIGQGIAVTPVQMAAAYGAIANGGIWSRPHLVDHVAGGSRPSLGRKRLVSANTAARVDGDAQRRRRGRNGQYAAMPGYQVAGKTGTAQKPDSHGGYATGSTSRRSSASSRRHVLAS